MNAVINYDTLEDTYDIRLKAPLSVCWQITTKCNLHCKYCLSSSGEEGKYGLDTKQAMQIINHLGGIGVNRLDFTRRRTITKKRFRKIN